MDSPAAGSPADRFDYLAQWYPLSPVEDLDPARPTAVELLGRRYVIWRPATTATTVTTAGTPFRVFLDVCPHRLAPLSEGRIDPVSGQLACSYHGWQFDQEGLCRKVPQLDPPEPDSSRARSLCATALPTREAQGLLWLWPDVTTADRAEATPLPLSEWLEPEAGFGRSSVVRDLPYDWRTLVENVADPAHVPFAHHGVQGKREMAAPLPLEITADSREQLVAEVSGSGFTRNTSILFQPPCLLEYRFTFPGERHMALVAYCLPTAPGRSRIVAQFSRDFALAAQRRIPRWWDHITNRNEVLDGDAVLLHHQERELERRQARDPSRPWASHYRLPATADRMVIAYRQWLDRHGGPDWSALIGPQAADPQAPGFQAAVSPAALGLPAPAAEPLLDRYHQHTIHCASCRGALKMVRRLELVGLALFALSLSVAALLPEALRLPLGLPLVLLGLSGLGSAAALRWWGEPWFRGRPYEHTRR